MDAKPSADSEKDPTLCSLFEKVGACPKGDLCNKSHRCLPLARAIVLHHIFPDPDLFLSMLPPGTLFIDADARKRLINAFFLDIAQALMHFGQIDDLVIAGNKCDHLSGNVICVFHESDAAHAAQEALNNQYYAGRRIVVTLAPVQRLSHGFCTEQMTKGRCEQGEQCSFVHPVEPSPHVFEQIFPKSVKSFPQPFRNARKPRTVDSPADALCGRTKASLFTNF